MRLFLGVDGGQSSTTALIGDETGEILGTGTGGPCNHVGVAEGPAKLKRVVSECVGKACVQAGMDPETVHFESACFGMSGGPADKEVLLVEILSTDRLFVTNDGVIALSGALAGEPGIVAIAGTGSIAFGRNAEGKTMRSGGWGYVFGDEGGAFDIVRQALRAALAHEEGWSPPTVLREVFLEATGAADINAALHAFYTAEWPRARVAGLAAAVDAVAAHDSIARRILMKAGRDLSGFAGGIRRQIWKPTEAVTSSYIGGAFRSEILRNQYCEVMESMYQCQTAAPKLSAAAGALLEAYREAAVTPDIGKLLSSNFRHGKTFHPGS